MLCAQCARTHAAGGTHLSTRQAIGICLACGEGVCAAHAERAEDRSIVCEGCRPRASGRGQTLGSDTVADPRTAP